ncbi:hypothetical protein SLS58_009287 [Diplodia intermedia]|uniref:Uncharacterized protein n=1 Tax=Diplodia intermedia TaxID=856260 RepID=A0ABR3TDU9_9PEZI
MSDAEPTKTCFKCGQTKPADDFPIELSDVIPPEIIAVSQALDDPAAHASDTAGDADADADATPREGQHQDGGDGSAVGEDDGGDVCEDIEDTSSEKTIRASTYHQRPTETDSEDLNRADSTDENEANGAIMRNIIAIRERILAKLTVGALRTERITQLQEECESLSTTTQKR